MKLHNECPDAVILSECVVLRMLENLMSPLRLQLPAATVHFLPADMPVALNAEKECVFQR